MNRPINGRSNLKRRYVNIIGWILEQLSTERYQREDRFLRIRRRVRRRMAVLHDASWHYESGPLSSDEEIDLQIAYATRTQ